MESCLETSCLGFMKEQGHNPTGEEGSQETKKKEEIGVPGHNPQLYGENMQTPCRKTPWPGVKPRTFLLQGNSATNCGSHCAAQVKAYPYQLFVKIYSFLMTVNIGFLYMFQMFPI
ncbi:hypothetical protein GOODEAATRI_014204 [Goodea atripinnis]|uniref:Uncharacterized protein n=1 Tax=Goodea atripinnis TaxID=208336 RepID=A0ABV0NK60_9TELE